MFKVRKFLAALVLAATLLVPVGGRAQVIGGGGSSGVQTGGGSSLPPNQAPPMTGNLDFHNHKGINLAPDTTTGDILSRGQSPLNSLAAPTGDYGMASHDLTGLRAGGAAGEGMAWGQLNGQLQNRQPGATVVSNTTSGWNTGGATSITGNAPASIVAGNALLVTLGWFTNPGAMGTLQTGWSTIGSLYHDASNSTYIESFCKIATNSEPASYTFSWTNSAFEAGGIVQVSNIASCTPDAVSNGSIDGGNQLATAPALTVTNTNDFVYAADRADGCSSCTIALPMVAIWSNGGTASGSYVAPISPSRAISVSNPTGSVLITIAQYALPQTQTITGPPALQGSAGNVMQDLTANTNRVINVAAPPYNAVCDNVTDDAAAIQTALNTGFDVSLPGTSFANVVSGGPNNAGAQTLCRTSVPLVDGSLMGRDFFGTGELTSGLFPSFGQGPAIIEANPTTEVTTVGPITKNDATWGIVPCWDGIGTPCGAATGGSPGQWAFDMKDWTDNGAASPACGAGTNPLNGCGPGQLTIQVEAWVPANNNGGGTITASGSNLTGTLQTLFMNVTTGGAAGNVNINMNYATSGIVGVGCATNCFTKGAWHHLAYVYDNHSGNGCTTTSCARAYLDGTQIQAADVVGNIVQPTYDTWWLGANSNHFPAGEPGMGGNAQYWNGMLAYVDIEKADLYPSGTAFTPPASKPTTGTSPIVLQDFDVNATIVGFGSTFAANGIMGVDKTIACNLGTANCSNAWSYFRIGALETGEIGTHSVHDMTIYNGGEGILGSNSIGLQLYNLNLNNFHVNIKVYNNSYAMYAENLILTTQGEGNIELAHNTGFNHADMIKANNGTAFELSAYDQSGGEFSGFFANPQLGGGVGNIMFGEDSTFTNFICRACLSDSENGAPTITNVWLEGGDPVFIGGDLQMPVGSNTPAVSILSGTTASFYGTHFESGDATHPVIHWLSAPSATSPHVLLSNPVVNSTLPSNQVALISDQLPWINFTGTDSLLKAAQTINGSVAGTAVCTQTAWQLYTKRAKCVLTGYNSNAQAYTFPVPFTSVPAVLNALGVGMSATTTVLNLPTGGAVSGTVLVEGQ